jgi:hypothetical protein
MVKLRDEDLNTDEFKPGSSGEARLRKTLELQTRLDNDTIWPSGRRQQTFDFKASLPTSSDEQADFPIDETLEQSSTREQQ